jgi:hypothetical protein
MNDATTQHAGLVDRASDAEREQTGPCWTA